MNVSFDSCMKVKPKQYKKIIRASKRKNARAYAYYGMSKQVTYNEIEIRPIMEGQKFSVKDFEMKI